MWRTRKVTQLCVTKLCACDRNCVRRIVFVRGGMRQSRVRQMAREKFLCDRCCVTKMCLTNSDKFLLKMVCVKVVCDKAACNGAMCETLCSEAGVWTTAPVTKLCATGSFLINLCLKDVTRWCVTRVVCMKAGE